MIQNLYQDAESYDFIHPVSKGMDFQFYRDLILSQGNKALEVACGTGRLTLPLAEAGISMTGLDLSAEMVEKAKEKAQIQKLSIQWFVKDCTQFSLQEKFPVIFIPCNSLQHLQTAQQVGAFLQRVRQHLEPNGLFAMDIFKPDPKILSRDPEQLFHVADYEKSSEKITVVEKTRYDGASQVNYIQWFHKDSSGKVVIENKLSMRQFFPLEMQCILEMNGFEILHSYGDWQKNKISNENFKQIYICSVR